MKAGKLHLPGLTGRLKRNRLASGLVANFTSLGALVVIQLLSVPVLAAAYGADGFGVWLLLATVPTYISMSDLGLVTAGTNEIAIRWARQDERGALAIFQSLWTGLAIMATLVTLVALAIVLATRPVEGLWPAELQPHLWVLPILVAYASLVQLTFVLVAGLRGTGYFARGTMLGDMPRFVEGLAMLATATITHDMTAAAGAMLVIRVVTMPFVYLGLRRVRPELSIGRAHASWEQMRRLLPSAVGVLMIPGSLAISLQGTVLIVGVMLGPAAVAVFSSVRTASRFGMQIAGMVVRAIVPELAAAHGRGDAAAKRRYWSLFQRARWAILIPLAFGFALAGGWLVEQWSLGELEPSYALVAVMGLALLPHGSWFLDFFMLTATHSHIALTRPILLICLAGLGLTAAAIAIGGLLGAAVSVLLLDLVLAWRVRRAVRRLL